MKSLIFVCLVLNAFSFVALGSDPATVPASNVGTEHWNSEFWEKGSSKSFWRAQKAPEKKKDRRPAVEPGKKK